jgi:hypothetical protein
MDGWNTMLPWDTYVRVRYYSDGQEKLNWNPQVQLIKEKYDRSQYYDRFKLATWLKSVVPAPKKEPFTLDEIKEYCLTELKKPGKIFILPECFWTECYSMGYKGQPIWYRKDTTL